MKVESLEYFKSLAYTFYPKGISPYYDREDYNRTKEYKLLLDTIKNRTSFSEKNKNELMNDLGEITKMNFDDFSLFSWEDRAYNLQSVIQYSDHLIEVMCLNISVIIPYYTIYCLRLAKIPNSIMIEEAPELDVNIYNQNKDKISGIEKLLEDNYNLNKFNEELKDIIIPDIGFKDIYLKKFTFFNAFFLDSYNHSRY